MGPRVSLIVSALLVALLLPATANAQDTLSLEVHVGFDAFYKTESWTPVRVTVSNLGADLQAELHFRDQHTGFDVSNVLYVYPVDLPAQSRKAFTLYLPLRGQRQLQVDLVDGQGRLLLTQRRSVEALDGQAMLVGVVASDPSLLNGLAGLSTANRQRVAVAHLGLEDLPPLPQAWNGLDVLVFNDVDTSRLSPAQQEALSTWLGFGGKLVVGGGPNAAQTIAGLQALLPFTETALQTLPHPLQGLQQFVQTRLEDRGPYPAAVPVDPGGYSLIWEGQASLVVGRPYNLGQVYYLAFDLGLAPLDVLGGHPDFLPKLLQPFEPVDGRFADPANWREMRSGLALISEQTLPTPRTVILYLVIYVLALGPLNYLVLRRLKRTEWAWFSIPAIILLFSAYGYVSGFRLRGGRPLVRQITVIQAEAGAPLADVASFIGVYSPFRADYQLQIDRPVLVESLYDPFGVNNELTVRAASPTRVENLRGDIGGMPAIVAHSSAPWPTFSADLRYDQATGKVQGTISNGTGQPLVDARLVVENVSTVLYVIDLGTLPPGQTAVDATVEQRRALDRFYDNPTGGPPDEVELVSKDITVRTMLGLGQGSQSRKRFVGSHLVGWQSGSPLAVDLVGARGDVRSDTLLLLGLPLATN